MNHDIIDKLQMTMDTVDNEHVSYIISKGLLDHLFKDIENLNIVDFAEECFTSTSTISRYVKSLGYSSFNELKKCCSERRIFSKELLHDNIDVSLFHGENDRENLKNYTENIAKSIQNFGEEINLDEIDILVEKIYHSKDIYFYGVQISALLVKHLQFMFLNMGKYIHFGLTSDKQRYNAKQCNENSLCIFCSVNGNYFLRGKSNFIDVKERGAETVLITQNQNLNIICDMNQVIYLGKYDNGSNGNYKFMIFVEILLNRYYKKYKDYL